MQIEDIAKRLEKLEAVKAHYPRHYPFFLCALRTGLRLGEIQALTWGDVELRGGFLEVKRGYTKGRYTAPKSGKTRRVDMSPQLADTLRVLHTERKREALAKWRGEVPDTVRGCWTSHHLKQPRFS